MTRPYYHLPFLHSSSEQNCVITSSSIFSNLYTREYAFNGLTANYWACLNNDADRWIQVRMPYALRNMTVTLVSPQGSAVRTSNIPVSGSFQGRQQRLDVDGAGELCRPQHRRPAALPRIP